MSEANAYCRFWLPSPVARRIGVLTCQSVQRDSSPPKWWLSDVLRGKPNIVEISGHDADGESI